MATFSVIKQLFMKIVIYTNVLSVSLATFYQTVIHTEKIYENINSADPNTFSNSMMSCTS